MAFVIGGIPAAPAPPLQPVGDDLSLADKLRAGARQYLAVKGFSSEKQPSGEMPSLTGRPDELSIQEADFLHTVACRWLEYAERLLSLEEAVKIGAKRRITKLDREVKRKYKKLEDSPTDFGLDYEAADEALAEIEERITLLQGIKDSLEKVRAAASRAITRHTKINGTKEMDT